MPAPDSEVFVDEWIVGPITLSDPRRHQNKPWIGRPILPSVTANDMNALADVVGFQKFGSTRCG